MHEHLNNSVDREELQMRESVSDDLHSADEKLSNSSLPQLTPGNNEDPEETEANNISRSFAGSDESANNSPKPTNNSGNYLPPGFTDLYSSVKGKGNPLSAGLSSEMNSATGISTNEVTVHTDSQADQLNRMLDSNAFAIGKEIFFGDGNFQPGINPGKQLLAHELVHTGQQGDNIVRRNNDEELKKLREYDQTSGNVSDDKSKLKAEKQSELDEFLNEQGGNQKHSLIGDEKQRQRDIGTEKKKLLKLDEQLKQLRYVYVHKLRQAGVSDQDTGDPFAPLAVPGVDRASFLKKAELLFQAYDLHIDEYNAINAELKSDREKLLESDAEKKQLYTDYGLSLTGVQAGKTKDPRTPLERAEELLKWAEAEARTTTTEYTELLRDKEKEDKKKKSKSDAFDAFSAAQKIIRDDLNGDITKLNVADLQLVLKYFLKGSLTDDDKFVLIMFLSRQINNDNIDKVFGYDNSSAVNPADIIKVLDTYDLLNYERRPYFEKKFNGSSNFLDLEKVRSTLITRLKDMKAAKDSNDALNKNKGWFTLSPYSTNKQEPYFPTGPRSFTSSFARNISQKKPTTLFPTVMFPSSGNIAANALQTAINEYEATSPYPPISTLQGPAWTYYVSYFNGAPPLTQSDFNTKYSTLSAIKFLLTTTMQPAQFVGGKYQTTGDMWKELGKELLFVAIETGVDYLQLKERLEYFKATNPSGYYTTLGSIGAAALVLSFVDQANSKASWAQTLTPIGQLGLSGSYSLVDKKLPVYDGSISNKLGFSWDTKRNDTPPGLSYFNSMYNQNNAHPYFKGADSVPGLFLNTGLTGSRTTTVNDKERDKLSYNFNMTLHCAPGSEGTTASEETVMGRIGMFIQQPFATAQTNSLINNSPQDDMYNLWGKSGFTYKKGSFTTGATLGGGGFNLSGDPQQRMFALDYKATVGMDKLKLGDFKLSANSTFSGSYADSPSKPEASTANLSFGTTLEWKTFKLSFSMDDDLTKPAVYNKYKLELEMNGLGRYSPWTVKAALMNFYNQGLDQAVINGGIIVGYKFGTGGTGFRMKKMYLH